MTFLDNFLQRWRIHKAKPFITAGSRLLDIGCHKGELLLKMASRLQAGVGIDVEDNVCFESPHLHFVKGHFPNALAPHHRFTHITALAVVEHIPATALPAFFEACFQFLEPQGLLICTIPHQRVDHILAVLRTLQLVDGMSLDEHHGYQVSQTLPLATAAGFELKVHRSFQLGLNHLFVFIKPG